MVSGIVAATKDSGDFSTFSAKEILKHWVPSRVMSFFLVWEVTGQKIFRINQLMKRGQDMINWCCPCSMYGMSLFFVSRFLNLWPMVFSPLGVS